MRKGEEKIDLIPFRQSGHVIWSAQRNDRYDLKGENNISWVLTMWQELTMCQTPAPSL